MVQVPGKLKKQGLGGANEGTSSFLEVREGVRQGRGKKMTHLVQNKK